METDQIAEALSTEPVSAGRLQVLERADGVTIINDAFNANTEPMLAGLETLTFVAEGRRTVAVPGEMEEPGDTAEAPRRRRPARGAWTPRSPNSARRAWSPS
ncbi:glutamate ligase domain-containing protein [Streptomyces xantholiticus]|uniref:Cyanophycin synthetase n=1 Tax=Streptomyces xantholiticus TaxID=68285 RepID=A0ABV1UY41_9ACTN